MTTIEEVLITATVSLIIVAFWLGTLWLNARRENKELSNQLDALTDHIFDLHDAVNDYSEELDKKVLGDKDFDTVEKVMDREG